MVCGAANSNWIHDFSPTGAAGRRLLFTRSPSVSAARSKEPPLDVTFGCRLAIGTSLAGTRNATTAASA